MTGVVRSSRCGTCQRRKVRCDEVKPVCGPCRKGKRICEDPVSKIKFTKPRVAADSAYQIAVRGHRPSVEPAKHVSIVSSTSAADGGTFQTMRVGFVRRTVDKYRYEDACGAFKIARYPALSATESLQYVLLDTFSGSNPGFRLSCVAEFMSSIPGRLGHSTAMDDAVACLIGRRLSLVGGGDVQTGRNQAKLYAKALHSLRAALEDPIEGLSEHTLCAVSILAQVELLGGGDPDAIKYITHAGGAARLIRCRGPSRHQSRFANLLLATQRGSIISEAVVRGDDCFLNSPEWTGISFASVHPSRIAQRCDDLECGLRAMPTLIKRIRQRAMGDTSIDKNTLLQQARQLQQSLHSVGEFINECLENGRDISERSTSHGDPLFPVHYRFSSRGFADACSLFWGVSIVLDTMIARLLPSSSPPSKYDELSNHCIRHRQQVCMCVEYALEYWPLGQLFVSGPLIWAYHGATVEEKAWIANALQKLATHIPDAKRFWSPVGLEAITRYWYGEVLP